MGMVQDAVSDALAAEISSHREWDEPPAVHPLYVTGGACRLGRLPLPDAIWMTAPPAQVLAALADCAGDYAGRLQAMAPGELHGVAFFTEIWMASARYGSAEAEDLAKRAEAAGGAGVDAAGAGGGQEHLGGGPGGDLLHRVAAARRG